MKVISTKGMIIKEVKVGEGNKILTILTPQYGKIQAGANGVRSFKSKISAGCSLFGFSDFVLKEGKEIYSISSAESIDSFYNIRLNIEKLALSTYFCELLNFVVPAGQAAEDILKLALNTMYFVSSSDDFKISKPVFELRLMNESGFAPNVSCCTVCQRRDRLEYFSIQEGGVLCSDCGGNIRISKAALSAMQYVLSCESKKIFSFKVSDEVQNELTRLSQQYILAHLERKPSSLDFLNSL